LVAVFGELQGYGTRIKQSKFERICKDKLRTTEPVSDFVRQSEFARDDTLDLSYVRSELTKALDAVQFFKKLYSNLDPDLDGAAYVTSRVLPHVTPLVNYPDSESFAQAVKRRGQREVNVGISKVPLFKSNVNYLLKLASNATVDLDNNQVITDANTFPLERSEVEMSSGGHTILVTKIHTGEDRVTFVDPRFGSSKKFVVSFQRLKKWGVEPDRKSILISLSQTLSNHDFDADTSQGA
jgi:hypothetical protein